MCLVDQELAKVLDALDRLNLWENTVVIFTGDHGEMNGAHRLTQKAAITFDEAAVVNLTVCVPDGYKGKRTAAIGSHVDLAPTLLEFAGLTKQQIRERYPHLKGRSLVPAVLNPDKGGPRGSVEAPGDGALFLWDGLHSLDLEWVATGALKTITDMGPKPPGGAEVAAERLKEAGRKYGAPDFSKRGFFRAVVDGHYKLVRWFSPLEYGNPSTLDELYRTGDIALYDLVNDPGELENLGNPEHPRYDPALVEQMLAKLQRLVEHEIGEEKPRFDLDMFGTREVKYREGHNERNRA